MLIPYDLATEYRRDPLGLDAPRPRLGWRLRGAGRGRRQTAYRVRVWEGAATPTRLWWDSGVVAGREPVVAYGGPAVASRQAFAWTVAVCDERGQWSTESAPARWEMGLLYPDDWGAQWIAAPDWTAAHDLPAGVPAPARALAPPALLRGTLMLAHAPVRARLYATALGAYEAHINGIRVGRVRLAPGWTDYRRRVRYQVYDVTGLLHEGANALGLLLGDGWYAGYLGFGGRRQVYGGTPAVLAQLEVEGPDGARRVLATDGGWCVRSGPILYSDFLMGEAYDARRAVPHWSEAESPNDPNDPWGPVVVREMPSLLVTADRDDGVVVAETVAPVAVSRIASRRWQFDLGRNLVGQPTLTVQGRRGTTLQLRCAEVLDADGHLYTANYRAAACTDILVLAGEGTERYTPTFAYRGFRYVELTADEALDAPPSLAVQVLESATGPAGQFRCGLPLVNQLHANILTSQRGNFVAVPTDCPQRDERLGWLGDAGAFAETAAYNRDVAAFFQGWLETVRDSQSEAGAFPDVAPRIVDEADGAPAWGDAGVTIPAVLHSMYGDDQLLTENYEAMQRWEGYIRAANPNGLWESRRANDFGDWLAVDASTDHTLLATAYYAMDVRLLQRMADRLGDTAAVREYAELGDRIRRAFQHAFLDESGRLAHPTQTGCVLALHLDLVPDAARAAVARQLVDDIAARSGHLSTGFAGTALLGQILCEAGFSDVAYEILTQTTYPSWGYMIRHGATSMWERWDGWTASHGFQNPEMNSFNHYALGSVGAWLYGWVAGLRPDPADPGFRSVVVAPYPDPSLGFVSASRLTPQGQLRVRWTLRRSGRLVLGVSVPPSTVATLHVPRRPGQQVWVRGRPADEAESLELLPDEERAFVCRVGSGSYRFVVDDRPSRS